MQESLPMSFLGNTIPPNLLLQITAQLAYEGPPRNSPNQPQPLGSLVPAGKRAAGNPIKSSFSSSNAAATPVFMFNRGFHKTESPCIFMQPSTPGTPKAMRKLSAGKVLECAGLPIRATNLPIGIRQDRNKPNASWQHVHKIEPWHVFTITSAMLVSF